MNTLIIALIALFVVLVIVLVVVKSKKKEGKAVMAKPQPPVQPGGQS